MKDVYIDLSSTDADILSSNFSVKVEIESKDLFKNKMKSIVIPIKIVQSDQTKTIS